MEILKLNIEGPYFWIDEPTIATAEIAQGVGVYLWTIASKQGELVYYIGVTARSFASRMKEHLIYYLSGMYGIFEPKAFANGVKQKLWEGMWRSGEEIRLPDFIARSDELLTAVHSMIRSMRFWLIPVPRDKSFDKKSFRRLLVRLEGALAIHLRNQGGLVGEFLDDIRYHYRVPNEEPITVSLKCDSPILGLPKEIVV